MKHSWVCGRCMAKKTYVPFNWNPTLSPKRGESGFIWRYTSLREQVVELTITSILRTNSVPVLKSSSNMNSYGDMESCRLPTCNLNVSQRASCFSPVVGRLWRITHSGWHIHHYVINSITVYLKGGWTPFWLYPLEYHSVGYACSIYLLFVFLKHKIMWVLCLFCMQLCYSCEDYYQLMSYPHCFSGIY